MAEKLEQRAVVKFCFLLGKTAGETIVMLEKAYKEVAMGKTQVYDWFSRFRNGELSLADQPRSGRPSTSQTDENIARIRELILEDRHRTTDDLVDLSGVSWSSCQRILSEELQIKIVAAKFVPHVLTVDQKQSRVDACRKLKEHLEIDPDVFSKVITGDESWCYAYEPETKQQSSEWNSSNSPCPKKARRAKSNVKTMLISFFDANGIVHTEFVPNGQTVNQTFYLQVLKRLRDAVRRKRPELWQSGECWLHHDNAPAHKALSVKQFLTKNSMTQLLHPTYSPDLAPCDFFLCPRMKKVLKGKRFADVEEVKKKMTEALKGITLQECQDCFEKWKTRLDRFIASNGLYFEGD